MFSISISCTRFNEVFPTSFLAILIPCTTQTTNKVIQYYSELINNKVKESNLFPFGKNSNLGLTLPIDFPDIIAG